MPATLVRVVLLDPDDTAGFTTDQIELSEQPNLQQPLELTDGRIGYPIASIPANTGRLAVSAIVCHPEPGPRVVFSVAEQLYSLNIEDATMVAESLRLAVRNLATRDGDDVRATADALEEALVSTPQAPPLEITPRQLTYVAESLWTKIGDISDDCAMLRQAIDDHGAQPHRER